MGRRWLLVAAPLVALAPGRGATSVPQNRKSWHASPEAIAKAEKQFRSFNFREEKVPAYTLPELLVANDGSPVTTAKQWQGVRRGELLALFRREMYGVAPGKPAGMRFETRNVQPAAMGGAATLKQVAVVLAGQGKSLSFNLVLFLPNQRKRPVPVFLLINHRTPEAIDPTRALRNEYWPAEEVVRRGYGIAAFQATELAPDKYDGFTTGIYPLFDTRGGDQRPGDAWGTLAAWAWGASRVMDYFEQDRDVDSSRVAIVGLSRGGKTALWAGATDERFALVIGHQSGGAGAALGKRVYGSNTAYRNRMFPHWLNGNYKKYSNNEASLPFDQHMLLALVAPRALYITSADDDLHADPRGSYLGLYHALPAYRLFDKKIDLPESMPPLNKPIHSGKVAYHIRSGIHALELYDWNRFMDFADIVFRTAKGGNAGRPRARSGTAVSTPSKKNQL